MDELRLKTVVSGNIMTNFVEEIDDILEHEGNDFLEYLHRQPAEQYLYKHAVSVAALMLKFSTHLMMSERSRMESGTGGLLHDIGKLAIPDRILLKPEPLTDEEMAVFKFYPRHGYLQLIEYPHISDEVIDICMHHHERFDGTGFPDLLDGDNIGYKSRMAAICDVFDALTSNRPYKKALPPLAALNRMMDMHGYFDMALLAKFMEAMQLFNHSAVVQLRSGELAIVRHSDDYDEKNSKYPITPYGFSPPLIMEIFHHINKVQQPVAREVVMSHEDRVENPVVKCWIHEPSKGHGWYGSWVHAKAS